MCGILQGGYIEVLIVSEYYGLQMDSISSMKKITAAKNKPIPASTVTEIEILSE